MIFILIFVQRRTVNDIWIGVGEIVSAGISLAGIVMVMPLNRRRGPEMTETSRGHAGRNPMRPIARAAETQRRHRRGRAMHGLRMQTHAGAQNDRQAQNRDGGWIAVNHKEIILQFRSREHS